MSELQIQETQSGLNLHGLAKVIIFSYLDSEDYGRALIANLPNVSDSEREQIRGAVHEMVNSDDGKTYWDDYDEIQVVLEANAKAQNSQTASQPITAPDRLRATRSSGG